MLTALTSAVALVVSLAVTPLVRLFAIRNGLLDQPPSIRVSHLARRIMSVPPLPGVPWKCPRRGIFRSATENSPGWAPSLPALLKQPPPEPQLRLRLWSVADTAQGLPLESG